MLTNESLIREKVVSQAGIPSSRKRIAVFQTRGCFQKLQPLHIAGGTGYWAGVSFNLSNSCSGLDEPESEFCRGSVVGKRLKFAAVLKASALENGWFHKLNTLASFLPSFGAWFYPT